MEPLEYLEINFLFDFHINLSMNILRRKIFPLRNQSHQGNNNELLASSKLVLCIKDCQNLGVPINCLN